MSPPHPASGELAAEVLEEAYHGTTLPLAKQVQPGAPLCQRCEVLPEPLHGPSTLHLRLPHTHTLGKVLRWLIRSPWPHRHERGTVSIDVPPGSLAPLLSPLDTLMTAPEKRDLRVLFQPQGHVTQLADLFETASFPAFVARERSTWLLNLLRGQDLFSVFQPIMRLHGEGAEVYGHECLLRATVDGQPVSPGGMFEMARAADLLFQLDLYARRTALLAAARFRLSGKVFINFAPNAIYEPKSCLRSTVMLLDELGLNREQVVFEITESERLPELGLLQDIVGYYRDHGLGVALDDVGAGYSSLSVLLALRPDYVKLDRALVQGVHERPEQALVVGKLLEAVQGLGLPVIAEGIEHEGELDWVRAHGVEFAQGYLFARPAVPPPLLMD